MADRMREQLLGYVLGALEESEQESLENDLDQNPKLMRDLALVRESLNPLWVVQPEYDPPPGLARRTCELVFAYPGQPYPGRSYPEQLCPKQWENPNQEAAKRPAKAAASAPPLLGLSAEGGGENRSSWLDLTVAVGIVAALLLLAFPAIQNSRFNARVFTCQDNLRQIGLALTQYGQTQHDYLPPVYDRGPYAGAGAFAPILLSNGFLDGQRWFICPDSPLAEDRGFRLPTLDDLWNASGEKLARLHRAMSGSLGYTLGYKEGGRYISPRNLRRPNFAIVSDAPNPADPTHQTLNHGGLGQNVLFADWHVSWYPRPLPPDRVDDVFVNELGAVDAGQHQDDSVIGPSDAVPRLRSNQPGCPATP
jgi:type II secretory pathway pseudopilin PulG